jgi:arylsulfatase A-like enzyme
VTDVAFATPGHATLRSDTRPVLSAAVPVRLRGARCALGGRCTARVPREVAGEPWLIVQIPREPTRRNGGANVLPTTWLLVEQPDNGVLELPGPIGSRERDRIVLRGVRPPAERDVTTAPVAIPDGARLRLATGVQRAAAQVDSAPIDMAVIALLEDGGARELHRKRLDPSRVPEDRRWHEVEIPLDAVAGRTVRFRFASRPVEPGDGRVSLPVWGDPTVWAPRRGDARPSVVLVSLDTLRARSTSTYGHELETTPYLTELARGGTLFARAFTTYANTLGSHASLFTGLDPASHAVLTLDRTFPAASPTLAETLRAAGYETAAVTENGLLEGTLGFRRGFATWFENEVPANAGDAPETFRRALAWARANERTPFFLFVHTYAVHLPYEPPPGYETLFEDGRPAAERDPVDRERLRYEQEVRALDDELRSFVAGLGSIVPPDRLLLVVTSDHGEEFGEHGQTTHLQLYDEVMHVPLLARWDGVVAAGQRAAASVSLIDVAPTILDLLGLPPLPAADGLSLAPIARGDASVLPRDVVFAQSEPYALTGDSWRFVARAADAKCLVAEDDAAECFDLEADPGERRPLAPGSTPRLAEVHRHALAYRARALPAIAGGGARTVRDGLREVDAATERKLRALGYAE